MLPSQLGSVELCALARDLVDVVQQYQQQHQAHTTLKMHNTRMGTWDEICVMAVDTVAHTEKLIVKISLAQLTPAEREQLQQQIGAHNQTLLDPEIVNHKNNSLFLH